MKKILAILLTALFLFNLAGYRLLFDYMQYRSDMQMEVSLDKNNYNENDLLAIKIPLSLPYVSDQQSFEPVSGEITVNGKILKYVKRKISGGNLILMCLPDNNKMRLASAKTEFFKNTNDLVQNNSSKKSGNTKAGAFKNLSTEYDVTAYQYTGSHQILLFTSHAENTVNWLPSVDLDLPDQPPRLI